MLVVRAIGNVLWLVLAGWWLALGYAIAGMVMFVLIITIPLGVQAFKLAGFALWPFGRTVIDDPDAAGRQGLSVFANVIWVLLAGWWLALAHVIAGVALCLTVIGIPFGFASFKMVPLAFWPFGQTVVSLEEAERAGYHQKVAVYTG